MKRPTPFKKILIANRGEIALRVMRSARALGYRTVAVYSTADAHARHVREADQAVCIGEPLPAQSYLCIPAIIEAAKMTGADAVHPGYGFLAENAAFAQACREAGLVFIGPSPEAITAMGNKAGAKELMIAAGVPCIPGYQGDDQSEARLTQEAALVGFPVMIKATAGGGGRGMRLVPTSAQFAELLRSAQSEAQNSFGDPHVILERAIIEPRKLLLIDEPTKGLAPAIVQNLADAFVELKAKNTTILLVEQNFNFVRSIADHVVVMDDGRVVHSGAMAALIEDEDLQARLLGLHPVARA